VGYVLSTPVVPEFLTGYEFVKFFLEISGDPGNTGRTPDDWLALVGIDPEDRHRLMRGYSHGMKNKVQMLCFLIGRPPVILLDEPLTSFDVVAALEMKNLTTVCLLTGPEGGLDLREVEQAKEAGFCICTLGKRILRCETAPLCALSAVMYATGEF
jgi:ABC-type Na+ transport system ATPase subunit NatA